MPEQQYINPRESVFIFLPSKGRPPRPLLDGIMRTLDAAEPEAASVVILIPEDDSPGDPEIEPLWVGPVLKEVGKVIVKEIAVEAVKGVAAVVRDHYKDERAARDAIAKKYGWG